MGGLSPYEGARRDLAREVLPEPRPGQFIALQGSNLMQPERPASSYTHR